MAKEDFIYFWGGTFSQWQPSPFKINGIKYNCCEQYMMACKALLFNDLESYNKIMKSDDPRYQKSIGRTVKGFNKDIWENACREIVYNANYAKFTQNHEMGDQLLAVPDTKEIVEASSEDSIWGIGLSGSDPRAWDKETWLGTNWLGIAIMDVKRALKKEIAGLV